MAGRTSLIPSDITTGLAAAVRTAREVDIPDPLELVRRTDLTRGIDAARGLAGDAAGALAETVTRVQSRGHRRSRRRQAMIGLAAGMIALAAFAGWRAWRRRSEANARESLVSTIGSEATTHGYPERIPVAMDTAATGELVGVAEPRSDDQSLSPEDRSTAAATHDEGVDRAVIEQATAGVGLPRA